MDAAIGVIVGAFFGMLFLFLINTPERAIAYKHNIVKKACEQTLPRDQHCIAKYVPEEELLNVQ